MNSSSTAKTILFWMFIILLCVVAVAHGVGQRPVRARRRTQLQRVHGPGGSRQRQGSHRLYLSPNSYEIEGEWREPAKKFRITVFKEAAPDLTKELRDKGVLINVKEVTRADWVNFPADRRAALLAGGLLDRHDAADAGRRKQGAELRQIARAAADRAAEESHVQGRRRYR